MTISKMSLPSWQKQLQWPAQATLKDLRHLFATTMNNASMPEAYRRVFDGASAGSSRHLFLHPPQRIAAALCVLTYSTGLTVILRVVGQDWLGSSRDGNMSKRLSVNLSL